MFYLHKNEIGFRKLEETDLPKLKELKDESWFGTVNTACLNMYDQIRWFESISNDKSSLYFIIRTGSVTYRVPGSKDIGFYGITDINNVNRSCSFTHSLFKDYRGKGYGLLSLCAAIDMTFEVFNLRRIDTWILENNCAEISIVGNVGFVEEGIKRKAIYKCGEYLDCKLFGLLREDWEKTYDDICNKSYKPKNNKKVKKSK
jgi:RimJ/RimL family protein N-acetyltransferase